MEDIVKQFAVAVTWYS